MSLKFSQKFPKLQIISNREIFLQEYAKDKVVLHGGCVDSALLDERTSSNLLLHDIIGKSAKRLVGVDVDQQGIEKMISRGYSDVYFADLENWDFEEKFDLIILGEIIEHVDNCGNFLSSIGKFCRPDTEIIFTTPNNYYFLFWIYSLFGKESIHPDHNYLFSYHSLKALLEKFNFKVKKNIILWEKIDFVRVNDKYFKKQLKKLAGLIFNTFQSIKYIAPQYGKGIIIIATYENASHN